VNSSAVLVSISLAVSLSALGPANSQQATLAKTCSYSLPSGNGKDEPLCIREANYDRDLCSAIEQFAVASSLPPDFFARLIWRESRFRPRAISPKGAVGIAQFMPGTAVLRGLDDSQHALKALRASARYLEDLRLRFGNLGLAAAAYNSGEQRVSFFLRTGGLPIETQNYVYGITGHTAEEWKTAKSEFKIPPLDDQRSFMDACVALAESRKLVEPADRSEGVWQPWGAQISAGPSSAVARSLYQRAAIRLPASLRGEQPLILRKRDRDFGYRPRYSARIGRAERADADKVCASVQQAGLPCFVFKNF
jgi:Transglycosylase SLT domain